MWAVFAAASAVFAGITAILAKLGIKNISSDTATAVRTVVVLVFSWAIALCTVPISSLFEISGKTLLFLCLSGMATGASWLCYFKALQLGNVNKVTAVDKCSVALTVILAAVFLGESLTPVKLLAVLILTAGALLMIEKKAASSEIRNGKWLLYAVLSMFFASLTSILGKVGISGIDSNLGTAIRTGVVLVMAWLMVFIKGKTGELKKVDGRSLGFLVLSGLTTGGSWLCYYRALQLGDAGYVVATDKLSVLVTVLFSCLVLKESLGKKGALGLVLLTGGTLLLAFSDKLI